MDKRIEKTKNKLENALFLLLEKETISSINVSSLCKASKINRNTFYAHYSTPNDVIEEICNQVLQSFQEELLGADISEEITVNKLTDIFTYSKAHRQMFSTLLSSHCENIFINKLKDVVTALMINRHFRETKNAYIRYDIQFNFYGTVHALIEWLNGGCQEDAHSMAEFIYSICKHNEALRKFQ